MSFSQKNYDVHFIGEHPLNRAFPEEIPLYNLAAGFNIRKIRYIFWMTDIKRLIKKIKPDILHAHGVASAGWLGAASGFRPLLVTAHGSDLLLLGQRSRLHQYLSKWALHKADYVTCVSPELADRARALGVATDRVEVANLGVDTNVFMPNPDSRSIRKRLGLKGNPLILSLRAIKDVYNPFDIVMSLPEILKVAPEAAILFFTYNADLDLLAKVQRYLIDKRLIENIFFIRGSEDDRTIAQYYQASDIAISVPSSDGTPLSVLEAMASELPVVVSNLPWLQDWITHEENGMIIPPGDIEALIHNTLQLAADPDLRHRIGFTARKTVCQQADRNSCIQRYERLYADLCYKITKQKR